MKTHAELNSLLVDDYLDLLNIAKQLGDEEWKEAILQALKEEVDANHHLDSTEVRQDLWSQFEGINEQMHDLLMQLKNAEGPEEKEQIIEAIWGLKVDRHAITRKLETMSRASAGHQ
ncbi:hypothetical protein P4H27_10865 [Paenibacillus taichungensis]|jgi:uncharacterized membrane protein YukC|uniref:Flagellar protein FliT n=1 Tax=Paenibacillus taichungensis TaxID=484184 RepID=A0ABX2MRY9_9BACL|nr:MULTISPECIES: hypothetical protein [Paenibacillus]OME83586.1 hypothetical protein BK122_09140 [Paenibacillus pabuli]MCZ1268269.1 hypothetical protein [Paenibacillus tundrae]MDR9745966.1 hypothetical protein [Paenibacillus taichungensis]MEC0107439.1 hypothetical protein [Paenibacillus taichungensis]MEC0195634.1 hypothetical protein [Paenibacillus taichungensis]